MRDFSASVVDCFPSISFLRSLLCFVGIDAPVDVDEFGRRQFAPSSF
jgi:hypothetical protein